MPDAEEHVRPYIHESPEGKALHFSMFEIQSRMKPEDPYALDLEYTRTMMGFLLFKPRPSALAMIGLGGGSMAKFCWRYLPHTRIEVVEINPHVIALRDQFHVPPDDARFAVVRGDGAQFVRHHPVPLDVLLVDGFDSEGQPEALCSQRFYDDCHDALQPDGLLVVNLYREHVHYEALLDRLRRSFGDAVLIVDAGARANSIVFASRGRALDLPRIAPVKPPAGLEAGAASQLLAGFALIASALKERRR